MIYNIIPKYIANAKLQNTSTPPSLNLAHPSIFLNPSLPTQRTSPDWLPPDAQPAHRSMTCPTRLADKRNTNMSDKLSEKLDKQKIIRTEQEAEKEDRKKEFYKQFKEERDQFIYKINSLEEALRAASTSNSEALSEHIALLDKDRIEFKENLENEFKKKKDDLEDERKKFKAKQANLNAEIDKLKSTIANLKDNLMKQKLEYTREEAKINQKLVFKDDKISELRKTIKESSQEYQERLDTLRSDLYSESQKKMTYLEEENQRFSEKLGDKAAILINLESEIIRLKSEQEEEKLISGQKVSSLESKLSMLKEEYDKKIEFINFESQSTIKQIDNEVQQLVKENDNLKTKLIDFEKDYTELHSNYERDKALWDDRLEFLEGQKNQAKRDLQDAHQKYEMTVERLERKDSSKRGKTKESKLNLDQQNC
ncbi:unnamed protein product [Moneuplotes crassus]|uniref:Uncharacterized protein n=1 Tax=Euplotes crassus TaxID=5936 RepID=A0AAD1U910_EUPCR|nr:unnamed protein product [Moneuplotes crassus]